MLILPCFTGFPNSCSRACHRHRHDPLMLMTDASTAASSEPRRLCVPRTSPHHELHACQAILKGRGDGRRIGLYAPAKFDTRPKFTSPRWFQGTRRALVGKRVSGLQASERTLVPYKHRRARRPAARQAARRERRNVTRADEALVTRSTKTRTPGNESA